MQLFIIVLTEGNYVPTILENLSENNYHGSVLSTRSIHHALLDSIEPDPYFGGLSKMVDSNVATSRPMIFVVMKEDSETKIISEIVNKAVGGIKGKGFMYALPISYLEGLDD